MNGDCMLNWEMLLNHERRKDNDPAKKGTSLKTAAGRIEIERDFDRILFSTPVRRLADKTQVFPLEKNDSVRTRLTHSYEVSNLCRSIGTQLVFDFPEEIFGKDHEKLLVKRNVPALLAGIGLAHDLGNPPFGHKGEVAIQEWFKTNEEEVFGGEDGTDFFNFDGNAQTLRLLTRLQILNDDYGLNLTYSTLSALMKYPSCWSSDEKDKGGYKKSGIFESEIDIVKEVWGKTGLKIGVRHPLTYIMEASDDIAYSVLDAEDTIKKSYASFYDLIDFLEHNSEGDPLIDELLEASVSKNKEFRDEQLSSKEINDISMQMLRVKAISIMVQAVTTCYVENIDKILDTDNPLQGFELIKVSNASKLCKTLKRFDYLHGYQHKSVLELELQGSNYINSLMDMLWKAIKVVDLEDSEKPFFAKYALSRISENYQRIYNKSTAGSKSYKKAQLLCDTISGMTDSYLIFLHDELKPLFDGYSTKQ